MQVSLLDGPENYADTKLETKTELLQGLALFRKAVTDVHVLHTTYRFVDSETMVKCPDLPRILEYMRCPRGRRIPAEASDQRSG